MSKYIDAEKLKAEIEKWSDGKLTLSLLIEIKELITSLQQEQSEVDLDREIIKYKVPFTDESEYLNETTLDAIARHFAEWGAIHLNTRKEK